MLYLLYLSLVLDTPTSDNSPSYGDVYLIEETEMTKRLKLSAGYTTNLTTSFTQDHGGYVIGQYHPFHWLGLGLSFQAVHPSKTALSGDLFKLKDLDIHHFIYAMDWSLCGLVTIPLLVGRWNVLNLAQIRSQWSVSVGGGVNHYEELNRKTTRIRPTYLWKTGASFYLTEPLWLEAAILGNRTQAYILLGFQIELFPQDQDN